MPKSRTYWLTLLGLALWFILAKHAAFPAFQEKSDRLVDSAYKYIVGGMAHDGWPSLRNPNGVIYSSQFGLQSILLTIPARLGIPAGMAGYWIPRVLASLLFSAVVLAFAGAIGRHFGERTRRWMVGLLAVAPWTLLMADSPYWMTGLLFLPFVFTWCRFEALAERKAWAVYYGLLFGAVLLKCLCGYEYLTNVTLSPLVPILFFAVRDRWPATRAVAIGAGAFFAGCAAFVVALGMHVALLSPIAGSPSEAMKIIRDRATARGSGGKDLTGDNGIYVPDDASYQSVVKAYFGGGRPPVRIDESQVSADKRELYMTDKANKIARVMGLTNLLLFLLSLGLIVVGWRKERLRPLALVALVALPISLTWFVFAFRHTYIHWHLDHIVFYLPFYFSTIALLAALLGNRGPEVSQQ